MAAGNQVRTFVADDAQKLNVIRDRCRRKLLLIQVDSVLIAYVEITYQDYVALLPLFRCTLANVRHNILP